VHLALDLLDDDPETLVLWILTRLILRPGLLVTFNAADGDARGLLVRDLGDVGMATDTQLFAVNARLELLRVDIDVDDGAVVPLLGLLLLVAVTLEAAFVGDDSLAGLGIDGGGSLLGRCLCVIGVFRASGQG